MVDFDSQIVSLTPTFYSSYPHTNYSEILEKDTRPYNCLLVETHYDFFICLPYRSHINHRYAFRFRTSARSRRTRSGIDYSKMVIVSNTDYFTANNVIVDQDEYRETMQNLNIIANDAVEYLEGYIEYINGTSALSQQEFNRKYSKSSLQYFHQEMGIDSEPE